MNIIVLTMLTIQKDTIIISSRNSKDITLQNKFLKIA